MSKRIVISGGGTGGHVFPAISIAEAIRAAEPDAELLFVGALGKIEMEKVPAAGFRIEGLPVAGLERRLTLRNLSFPVKLARSLGQAKDLLRAFRPHAAVGVGGYASGPVLWQAARMGVPCLVQEQNSHAGLTNRLLARSASTICVAYEGMEKFFAKEKIVLTGNPVREALAQGLPSPQEARASLGLDPGRTTVLVLGGSGGAASLNRGMAGALERLAGQRGAQFFWQTGKAYLDGCQRACDEHAQRGLDLSGVRLAAFIADMRAAFAAADLVVSRAGAGTISELALLGKPTLLVPSPNVAEDHQTRNAMALVSKGAAAMLADAQAPALLVERALEMAGNPRLLADMALKIKSLSKPDASRQIAGLVLGLCQTNTI